MDEQVKEVQLKYGKGELTCPSPQNAIRLVVDEPAKEYSHESFISELQQRIGDRNLTGEIAIVVADKTRLCGYPTLLPWVFSTLTQKGVDHSQIRCYIAYGSHARQSDAECVEAYGEIYSTARFIHHDCHQQQDFTTLGITRRGTPARVRRDLIEADLILTIGAVSHHYFAGYGGGRKLLFPGLAEASAIYANHRLFLDTSRNRLEPQCRAGNLPGNPIAEDLKEIHDLMPDYLSIHTLLNRRGELAGIRFGDSYEDFLVVCQELDSYYKLTTTEQYPLVLASAGGHPRDINVIQSHKSMHNAAALVANGGTLILFAACSEGLGSDTFLEYFEMGDKSEVFAHLKNNYAGNGGTALAIMEKTSRITLMLVTELSAELCIKLGLKKISIEEVAEIVNNETGTAAIIENGALVVT